jgi:hypothetical protein
MTNTRSLNVSMTPRIFLFVLLVLVFRCDRSLRVDGRSREEVSGGDRATISGRSLASHAAPATSRPAHTGTPSVGAPRASAGSRCTSRSEAPLVCEEGLECFETAVGGDVGVCAERVDVETLLREGERFVSHWVGIRNGTVGHIGFGCTTAMCSLNERCQACDALLVLAHPGGRLFLLQKGAHLKCTSRKGGGLGMEPPRCEVPLGEYAAVAGRFVKVGPGFGKLDATVLTRLSPTRDGGVDQTRD